TRCLRDWSSDVCSSDLLASFSAAATFLIGSLAVAGDGPTPAPAPPTPDQVAAAFLSSDEAGRAVAEKAIAAATPEFLRSVLASEIGRASGRACGCGSVG